MPENLPSDFPILYQTQIDKSNKKIYGFIEGDTTVSNQELQSWQQNRPLPRREREKYGVN